MWKILFIVLAVITLSHAQTTNKSTDVGRKYPFKYHHHHGLYYLTHYWVFLAIKAKIIFLIGSFISIWVFAGKIFAFLYYYKNKESNCKCPHYHEKIVLPEEPPQYQHKYSTLSHAPDYFLPQRTSPYPLPFGKFSRSFQDSIFTNMGVLKWIIKKADVSDLAFDAMNLKGKCRRRFVCEADQDAKNNPLRSLIFYFFSDVGLMKYRTNLTMNSLQECEALGPQCN